MKKIIPAIVTVYVNDDGNVISKANFDKLVVAKAAAYEADASRMTDYLEDTEYLSAGDIARMSEAERAEVNARWAEQAILDAKEDLLSDCWTKQQVEVEVEVEFEIAVDVKAVA